MAEQAAVSPGWRKSTYSTGASDNCVEVGAFPWRKSTYSTGASSNCVEAAHVPGMVMVRDTKDNGAGPVLHVNPADWRRLTRTLRAIPLA